MPNIKSGARPARWVLLESRSRVRWPARNAQVLSQLAAGASAITALACGRGTGTSGRLEHSEDIFFLTLPEGIDALAGADLRPLVSDRRALYEQELARRHVPLVLLSDGTEPPLQQHIDAAALGSMQGAPASPGVVTAPARVVLDPRDARLESGGDPGGTLHRSRLDASFPQSSRSCDGSGRSDGPRRAGRA